MLVIGLNDQGLRFSLDFLFVFSSKREAETRLINVFTLK